MATYDGSLRFDTKIDSTGFDKGISLMKKAAGVLSFSALSKEIIDVGTAFEASMSQVAAVSLATGEELDALTAAAKEMGATTKYTAAEAADGLQFLSQAGYTAAESIEALPKVLRLAQAGGMDLAYASELLTDSMAVMGLGIKDMDNFSDQLAMAAAKSNASVAQLGEAVLIAGGQAKLAAMSTEEMNTALGILADNGIKGSEGGTALRNVLKNLYTPTSASAKVMKKLGLETADANGNLKDAQDVLKELKEKLDGMDESSRIKAMGDIFDTRTIAAANALLENSGERWDELEGYLSSCDGAAKTMAETMNDNLKGSLDEMSSAAEALGITIYEKAEPSLSELVQTATKAITAIDKFTQSTAGDILVGAVAAIASATVGYTAFAGAVKIATVAQAAFNAVQTASPIGLATAGVLAAVAAGKVLENALYGEIRALEKEKEAYAESRTAAIENAEANALEIQRAQALASELDKVVDANGKVKDGYEDRVEYILGELKEATGEEYKLVDGTISKYDELKQSIHEVLKAKEMEALSKGVSENYSTAVQNVEEYRKKMVELKLELDRVTRASQEEIKQTGAIPEAMLRANEAYQESVDLYEAATRDKLHYGEMLAAAEEGNYDMFMQLYRDYNGAVEGNTTTALSSARKRKLEYEAEVKSLQDLKKEAETSGDIQLAEQYANDIITLQGEIAKLDEIIATETEAIKQQALESGKFIGQNITAGVASGILDGVWLVNSASASMVNSAFGAGKKAADIHSPSKRARKEIGKMMSLGVAYGIEDGAPVAISKMEELANSLIDSSLEGEERQEAIAKRMIDSLKNSLTLGVITEEQYYSQLAQLRDAYFKEGSEDWEKYSLDILKYSIDSAEEQKEALSDIYESILSDTQQKLEAVKAAQERMSESLSGMSNGFGTITYKGILENGEDVTDTVLNVSGLRAANDDKERFAAAAENARKRIANSLGSENAE
ncbi:MAG: phage tail tape measure protein, partial [Clostridia bacterium]|nr:phage tail tape measure protein [Clostridia bacterium]